MGKYRVLLGTTGSGLFLFVPVRGVRRDWGVFDKLVLRINDFTEGRDLILPWTLRIVWLSRLTELLLIQSSEL